MITDAIRGENFKALVIRGFIYAGTLAISTAAYIKIAHLIYPNMGEETYGGISEMGKISISELPKNFGRVYKRVMEYFITRPFAFVTTSMHITNIVICALLIALTIVCVYKFTLWERKLELAFIGLMAFLFPFAVGFVYFMAPKAPFSMLMLYAYSMISVFVICLSEFVMQDWVKTDVSNKRILGTEFETWGAALVTIVILFSCYGNYLLDSQAYFRTSIAYERATNYYNRILSGIEMTEGYNTGDRIVILGEFYYKDNPSPIEIPMFYDDEGFRELDGVTLENGFITSGVRNNFIRSYLGFNPGIVSDSEKVDIQNTPEYKKMPEYPKKGSIAKINDIWVVKLCE